MRVFDLDREISVAIVRDLHARVQNVTALVLSDGQPPQSDDSLFVTSTKLVELRIPLPDGSLRPPLCVFIPPGAKTSAEDSFGAATFEDFYIGDVYRDLSEDL